MKLSTKGRYGLRALIDLAVYCTDEAAEETVSIQSIAKRQNIYDRYLEQLMGKLRRAVLVVSVRGAGGGYRLARPASEISVGEVLRVLEGNLDAVTCPGNGEEQGCEEADMCVTRYVWKRINDSITQAVDTIMIEQLVEESRRIREEKGRVCSQSCEKKNGGKQ